ncbi:MAG: superoxide dismutase [Phycisphaerae bacterium]
MAYELPKLPYAYDALAPHIDAKTMEIHHTKHHQGYIDKANAILEKHPDLAGMPVEKLLRSIEEVPEADRQGLINNAGGHANHSLFWQVMGPNKGGKPSGAIAADIDSIFGGFDKFKSQFEEAAKTRFGSGWAWLCVKGGKLTVHSTKNQDSPLMEGCVPVLGLDVWEHAYYLNYQNRRPDYVSAFWNVVNWDKVNEFYQAAKK